MQSINTKEKSEFIFDHAFWVAVSMIWYKNTLFKCIPNYTLKASEIILWSLVLLLTALGVALTFANHRNSISTLVNILIPYELYTVIVFWRDQKRFATISLCVSLLLTICYLILLFSPKIKSSEKRGRIIIRRAKRAFLGSRTIISFCMIIFLLPMGINAVFGRTVAFKAADAEVPSEDYECTIANNIDKVCNLRQEKWETLSLSEKANTLQTVANIEAYYLGLPHELNIKVMDVGDSTVSQYDDKTHSITLNSSFLDSAEASEALNSLCHEAYHAYQLRLCDACNSMDPKYRSLLSFNNVPSYQQEFQNYNNGEKYFMDYYYQVCEVTAREYAETSVQEYYYKIELYQEE